MQRCVVGLLSIRSGAVGGTCPPPRLLALLDRSLVKLAKTLADMLDTHPWSCFASGMLAAHLDACWSHLTSAASGNDQSSALQRLGVHMLRFLYVVRGGFVVSRWEPPRCA